MTAPKNEPAGAPPRASSSSSPFARRLLRWFFEALGGQPRQRREVPELLAADQRKLGLAHRREIRRGKPRANCRAASKPASSASESPADESSSTGGSGARRRLGGCVGRCCKCERSHRVLGLRSLGRFREGQGGPCSVGLGPCRGRHRRVIRGLRRVRLLYTMVRTPPSGYHNAGVSTTRPLTCATSATLSLTLFASWSSFNRSTPARFMSLSSSSHLLEILAHLLRSSPAARCGSNGATSSQFTRAAVPISCTTAPSARILSS